MTQIGLQRNVSVVFKSFLNYQAYTVELKRNAGGWKRRLLKYEAKKDIVFQYAGKKAHRSDRIYVWGCSATGALGKIVVVWLWLLIILSIIFIMRCYASAVCGVAVCLSVGLWQVMSSMTRSYPVWGRGTPFCLCFSLVHLLTHSLLFLFFCPFFFSYSLYLFSSIVHPTPFYQSHPISFPGRRS